jgi:thiol:disulfide interchange protein DsbD
MGLDLVPGTLSQHPVLAIPLLFAGGVLTSLTPCIYPMIPITAAVVGGQGSTVGRGLGSGSARRAAILTASYVGGLSLTYALLGLVAGLTGTLFGSISTNPWLYFLQANLLVGFGLMLLDILPVPVPQRLLQRAATLEGRGRVAGTFLMGAASGLVAAPCGAPVMAAVLTWVASTHDPLRGFVYLFTFSLGMCALLVLVGLATGGAVRLPRPGPWMLWVKRGFAATLLAVAEYYLIQMGALLI